MKTLLCALHVALCTLIRVDFGLAVLLAMHGLISNVLMLIKIVFLKFIIAQNVVCKYVYISVCIFLLYYHHFPSLYSLDYVFWCSEKLYHHL